MASIQELAQALQQGRIAPVASSTGQIAGQQISPQDLAQALRGRPQQQEQLPTRQGLTLADALLDVRDDRLGNPIIRGLAGFQGARAVRSEREAAEREKRKAEEGTTAATELAKIERDRAFELKERGFESEDAARLEELDIKRRDLDRKEREFAAKAGKPKEFKGDQTKNASFANRMVNTASRLAGLEAAGVSTTGTLPNIAQSPEEQQFLRDKKDFVTAILRKESGAAIGEQEFELEDQKFFPQIGDSAEVIASKRRARADAARGLVKESQGAFEGLFPEGVEILDGLDDIGRGGTRKDFAPDVIVDGSVNLANSKVQKAFDAGFTEEDILTRFGGK